MYFFFVFNPYFVSKYIHFFVCFKNKTDYDEPIHRQRGQIIRLVTALNMTAQRHQHHHNISVPQLRSPFHRTSNPTISVRVVDVAVFDRQDRSTNSTKNRLSSKNTKTFQENSFSVLFLCRFRYDFFSSLFFS